MTRSARAWTPATAMHLSPAATEDAIRLLDGRQSGAVHAEKFGDTLDTRRRRSEAMRSAFALKRYGDNFRMITGARKLERATGIEPV